MPTPLTDPAFDRNHVAFDPADVLEVDLCLPGLVACTDHFPEKALVVAVLTEAFTDLRSRVTLVREQARHYVLSTDRTWPYSFEPLCEVLGLDPQAVRAAVLR